MKLKITDKRDGSFEGDTGRIEYYWYKALREGDEVTIDFGSRREYDIDDKVDLVLNKEEYRTPKGAIKFRYKEVVKN